MLKAGRMRDEAQNDNVVVLGERRPIELPLERPVTRLVSRPSVRVINGRLVAVLELIRSAA